MDVPNEAFLTGDVTNVVFNFDDLGNTAFTADVEDKSGLIASYKVYATWTREGVESDTAFIEEYTSFPVQINLSATEVVTAFDSTVANLMLGDIINFHSTITNKNGIVFTTDNINADLFGSLGQKQLMTYSGYVGCPIAAEFTGDYYLEQTAGGSWLHLFFGMPHYIFYPRIVTIRASNLFTRTMKVTYARDYEVDFSFSLFCGNVIVNETLSGISCPSPMGWVQDSIPATYNPSDDSSFEIFLIDNYLESCFPAHPGVVLSLTKVEDAE